jgi:Tol biopolymer transport system component
VDSDLHPDDPARVAHFRLLGRLGQGGMGVVYRAEDEKLRRVVALKLLPDASRNEERRQRFLREARSAAAITHPNVATIHQVDEVDGRVYIAMELVLGDSLRDRLEGGPLDLVTARELAIQIARGLAAAHDKGIVHRDLKPENVMITPDGVVKLLDFGLAKAASESPQTGKTAAALAKTETRVTSEDGRVMGTPDYMSPEQAVGAPLDVRSDVFSFGIVFYEMLAASRPFLATTTGGMLVAIARDPMQPLRERVPGIDEATAEVVERCLAKAPGDRFANAGEIVAALGGRGVSPRATTRSQTDVRGPVATTAATASPVRRPRLGPALVAAVALIGVGLLAWRWSAAGAQSASATSTPASPSASAASPALPPARTYKPRRLTAYPASDVIQDATLTPDGASLVFADTDGFWVQPLAGGARHALGVPLARGDHANNLSVFPDGTRVIAGVERNDVCTSWMATVDGAPAHLLHDGVGGAIFVSHDGRRVAACRNDNRLEIMPVDDGAWETVATGCFVTGPIRWSPDDKRLAFESAALDALLVASTDGSHTEILHKDPGLAMFGGGALDWPERGRIVFASRGQQAGEATLQEIAVDDEGRASSPARELWSTHAVNLASLSIVGGRMSVITTETQDDIYVARLGPGAKRLDGAPERLSMSDADDRTPQWLADGRVAYYSERDLAGSIYAQTPGKSDAQVLVAPPVEPMFSALKTGELLYRRPLGPDGGLLAELGSAAVDRYMVRRPGAAESELVRGPKGSLRIRCGGSDATHCVLGEVRSGVRTLAHVDLGTGRVDAPFSRVPFDGSQPLFSVSPDGGTVIATSAGRTLTSIRVADGSSREFSTTPVASQVEAFDFTPDGRGLVFAGLGVDGATYGMAHIDLSGRGETLLTAVNAWMVYPAVSSDGKSVAFQEQVYDSDVWLLEPQ